MPETLGPTRTDFAAPWGTHLRVTSVLLVAVMSGTFALAIGLLPAGAPAAARWLAIWTAPLVLVLSVPFVVRGYRLEPGELRIRRLGWTTRVSLAGLKSVKADPGAMMGATRLLGNGGGFVFAGLFRSRDLGLFRAFVNDFSRGVVLRLPARTVVVSPDDPGEFVRAVRGAVPGFEALEAMETLERPESVEVRGGRSGSSSR